MNETATQASADLQERENRRLTLEMVLGDLVAEELLDEAHATEMRITNQRRSGPAIHPLVLVADQNYRASKPPHAPMTLDFLTRWLAEL